MHIDRTRYVSSKMTSSSFRSVKVRGMWLYGDKFLKELSRSSCCDFHCEYRMFVLPDGGFHMLYCQVSLKSSDHVKFWVTFAGDELQKLQAETGLSETLRLFNFTLLTTCKHTCEKSSLHVSSALNSATGLQAPNAKIWYLISNLFNKQ